MNKTINILLSLFLAVSLFSCEELEFGDDFLQKPSSGDVTLDTVFSNIANAQYALTAAYSTLPYRIPYKWATGGNMMNMEVTESLTDLCQSYLGWGGANRYYYSGTMDAALMNSSGHSLFHFTKEGSWVGIRRAWTFIENIDRVPDADQTTIDILKGEAYMIIAMHYTELFRYYGGLPWVDKAFEPGDDTYAPRMTAEATMDSIASLCDRAAEVLPWRLDDISNDEGRFTKAAAMGLKVRVLLYGASPLYNNNEKYREGEACDQNITWFGGYDVKHWERVVTASEEFLNELNSSGGYAMVNTGDPRADFKSGYYDRGTSETLISTRQYYKNNGDWGTGLFIMWCYGAEAGVARPTQELVDMYPMLNGQDITDPTSGYNPSDPYINRDPRLYETVIVNGDAFKGRTAELWTGGRERPNLGFEGAGTGYMLRKFFLDGDAATSKTAIVHWPYLRLPEIYLSYAEALNEVNGGPTATAYEYLNKTRERVGVGPVPENLSKEEFLEEVLRERAREFCMEEIRWHDIVRHKLPFIQPHGIEITKEDDGSFTYEIKNTDKYKRLWVDNWDTKWYLGPIPSDEINKGYGLIQNAGW